MSSHRWSKNKKKIASKYLIVNSEDHQQLRISERSLLTMSAIKMRLVFKCWYKNGSLLLNLTFLIRTFDYLVYTLYKWSVGFERLNEPHSYVLRYSSHTAINKEKKKKKKTIDRNSCTWCVFVSLFFLSFSMLYIFNLNPFKVTSIDR